MLNRIIIKNIGAISNADIILDKPLNIFEGKIKQGKTTILNAIKWACGGAFPNDILKHNTTIGSVRLEFENESVERKFFLNNKGEVKAKPIEYIIDGKLQSKPVDKLKLKLNPFQLNQNYFTNMNAIDKSRYLVSHFNVDTTQEDSELQKLKENGKLLRNDIDNYIPLQLEEVKAVDENKLIKAREVIDEQNKQVEINVKFNEELTNKKITVSEEIKDLENKILQARQEQEELDKLGLKEIKEVQSVDVINEQIQEAKLTNYKADQYKKAVLEEGDKASIIQEKRQDLDILIQEYKSKEKKKHAKLIGVNNTHGIIGLEFIEGGKFLYEKTSADMLSTSQQMQLSSSLQSKYPDAFKFETLDQGESLGESIYDLIETAKNDNKTILVTKVGSSTAKTPDEANVFVVEKGNITKK